MKRAKTNPMTGYVPLSWPKDSKLSADEQEIVEIQRRDLWRHGVRTEPNLTRMAFEFGAVVCMFRDAHDGATGAGCYVVDRRQR